MNDQILLLKAENIELRDQLAKHAIDPATGAAVVQLTTEIAALRSLLGDVHTGMLAAGWHDDVLKARVKAAVKP